MRWSKVGFKIEGSIPVFVEHGWINPTENVLTYVDDKKHQWLGTNGEVLPEHKLDASKFVFMDLVGECLDFK